MDKESFRKTEGRLYRYFKQLKLIDKLKSKVTLLHDQQKAIQEEIKNLKGLNIDIGLNMGIDYSRDKIQTSSDGSSEAEREIIRYIENLEKEYQYAVKKMLKINAKIREIELQVQDMQYNLSMLNEESKRFIEWKYAEGKSIDFIAVEMYGGARSTAYRKREELVESIAQWGKIILQG